MWASFNLKCDNDRTLYLCLVIKVDLGSPCMLSNKVVAATVNWEVLNQFSLNLNNKLNINVTKNRYFNWRHKKENPQCFWSIMHDMMKSLFKRKMINIIWRKLVFFLIPCSLFWFGLFKQNRAREQWENIKTM